MNRTGLLIALALAAAIGLLFGIYPKLDLALERPFFDPAAPAGGFWALYNPVLNRVRDLARLISALLVAPAILAVLGKLIAPRRRMLIPGRAAVLLIATLALGPGLLTNGVLKHFWGRPRPIDVSDFAGDLRFVPWWDPRGECPTNCSFVAGEPSGAFWALAPAVLAPAAWRAAATAAALAFGAGIGLIRMAGGGHFFTDVAFAGLFTFLIIWVGHGLLFRWPTTRPSDRAVERALERLARPWRRPPKPVGPSAAGTPWPAHAAREGE
jgi:lipid A 4'-phosphatase